MWEVDKFESYYQYSFFDFRFVMIDQKNPWYEILLESIHLHIIQLDVKKINLRIFFFTIFFTVFLRLGKSGDETAKFWHQIRDKEAKILEQHSNRSKSYGASDVGPNFERHNDQNLEIRRKTRVTVSFVRITILK